MNRIGEICPIKLYTENEYVVQLSSTTFVLYGKESTRMYIICTDEDEKKIHEKSLKLSGTNYVKIYKNCDITLKNYFLSGSLPFTVDLKSKMIEMELHI